MDANTTSDNRPPFQFTGYQQQVFAALGLKSQGLADLYEAAHRLFREPGFPARLILAAHSLRELADGLPKALDMPIPVDPAFITSQINLLEPTWSHALTSGCHHDGDWTGKIDTPLLKLLKQLHEFFEWLAVNRPKRSLVTIQMFRATDPSRQAIPEALEQTRVKAWKDLRRYFSNTAHGEPTTEEDFAAKLEALDRILFDSVCRTPSVGLSEIDRILEEGASDA